jgi:SSS family solute:Na+ symporter
MPLREKPFTTEEHLRYLRYSIIGIGAFAFLISSFFSIKEYIQMWFAITGAIYTGGAVCAVVGGLYWKRGSTAGAWAGLITGSSLSVTSIIARYTIGDFTLFGYQPNSLHIAMMVATASIGIYVVVSLFTCKQPHNMPKLLHRGKYTIQEERQEKSKKQSWWSKKLGVTKEFTRGDKIIYYGLMSLSLFWTGVFWVVAIWAFTTEVGPTFWKTYWSWAQGYGFFMVCFCTIWFGWGGLMDCLRLFRDLKTKSINEHDDGTVHGDHSAIDEDLGVAE